jgi:hypothetical protein
VLALVVSLFYSRYKYIRFFYSDTAYINVLVKDNESFDEFLAWTEEKGLTVSQISVSPDNVVTLHMNDIGIKREFKLVSGKYPDASSFLSEQSSESAFQSGRIKRIIPGYSFKIYGLEKPVNVGFSDRYFIRTDSEELLEQMTYDLADNVQIEFVETWGNNPIVLTIASFEKVYTVFFLFFVLSSIVMISCMTRYFVIRKRYSIAMQNSLEAKKSTIAGKLFSRLRGLRPIYVMIKIIMVLILLYTTAIFSSLLTQSKNLLKNQKVWDDSAKDIYVLRINDVGQDIETEIEIDVQKRISKLYGYLCDNNNAFFMDAEDYFAYKQYGGDIDINGLLTDGFYTHITVSPNYFLYNPINTIDNNNVLDEVVVSNQVLNILVPESLLYLQDKYEEQFLDYFDFYRNKVYRNIYSHEADDTWETIPVEKMKINIIPVKNDQWYFTFSTDINESTFNSISDPVVVVYTDNFHPSTTLAMSSSCLYFENNSSIDSINSKMEEITGLKGFVYSESIQQKEHKRIADAQKVLIIGLCLIIYITVTIIAATYLNSCFAKHKILFALNVFTVILPYIILLAILQLKSYRVIRIIRRLPIIVLIIILLALLMHDIFCMIKEKSVKELRE